MTIEITKPELEALLQERLENGGSQNLEDIILEALKSTLAPAPRFTKKNFAQFLLDSPLPGSGLILERDKDYPRPAEL